MTSADGERLNQLIERAGPDVLAYFERRVRDREDAADLLGETLLVAWRRADVVPRDPVQARMWLFGVARGVLSNHARGVRRRLRLADSLRSQLELAAREAAREAPGGAARDAVVEAVEALPVELAELVRLVHWDGFSLTEAAELMGVGSSTARSRYARARELLREALDAGPLSRSRKLEAGSRLLSGKPRLSEMCPKSCVREVENLT
ncbi:MAG: sigma-70 family RNA polymerase sigma factor [Actinomycetales bacterium]|nr:sigma-70 family RNA polymerase sigma factor [Actinomycetales bacterium]